MAKVMLVEDDNNLREIYEARMQAEGYEVCTASDGEQALVVAKAEKPDLVVSDVMMPKISGFEMLDILRNTDGLRDVKVIMLTALGQTDDQARADRLGADRYLVKSQVTLEDIVNVAHQLLNDLPEAAAAEPVASAPVAAVPTEPVAEQPVPVVVATEPVAEPVVETVIPVAMAAEPAVTAVAVDPLAVKPVSATPGAPDSPPTSGSTSPQTTFSAVQVEPSTSPVSAPVASVAVPQASEPPVIATADAPDTLDTAQSSAQEEAAVEAQIEEFIAGATPADPTTAAEIAPAAPVADAQKSADAASDDRLMADAVDSLIASTPASNPPAPTPTVEPVVAPEGSGVNPSAPASDPTSIAVTPQAAEVSTAAPQPAAPVSMIAGKKIISPLSGNDPTPNLTDLLAKEDAKEIIVQSAASADMPQAPAAAPLADGRIDPNSIAL